MTGVAKLGVGFLGAGPVTQAIHVPTLARLGDLFQVVHVMDVDGSVAQAVASRLRARHSSSIETLLRDPAVDVVAVCSPHRFHAEQVVAACRAGVRAVLCEKPFAMTWEEAALIADVSAETGVPVLVGAMHSFDPGWVALRRGWGQFAAEVHTVHSSIVLPPNSRFEDFATEVLHRPSVPPMDLHAPEAAAELVHAGVMGLAIHDLPLVREFIPAFDDLEVQAAHAVEPAGYQITLSAGGRVVHLHAALTDTWRPQWLLEAWSDTASARVEFTPSYVHAGSAIASLTEADRATEYGPERSNGYEGEWRELAGIVHGTATPVSASTLVDDLRFAIAIADAAAAVARETHGARQGVLQ